jgi:hypothetical protein
MTPTAKLRFVERTEKMDPFYRMVDANGNMVPSVRTYRVLQQWWGDPEWPSIGEWRDVPVEKEETK